MLLNHLCVCVQWHVIIGCGALPGLFVLHHAYTTLQDSQTFLSAQRAHNKSSFWANLCNPVYRWQRILAH